MMKNNFEENFGICFYSFKKEKFFWNKSIFNKDFLKKCFLKGQTYVIKWIAVKFIK